MKRSRTLNRCTMKSLVGVVAILGGGFVLTHAQCAFAYGEGDTVTLTAYSAKCKNENKEGKKGKTGGQDGSSIYVKGQAGVSLKPSDYTLTDRGESGKYEATNKAENWVMVAIPQRQPGQSKLKIGCTFNLDAPGFAGITFRAGDHYAGNSNGKYKMDISRPCEEISRGMPVEGVIGQKMGENKMGTFPEKGKIVNVHCDSTSGKNKAVVAPTTNQ